MSILDRNQRVLILCHLLGFAFPFMLNALLDRLEFSWALRAWALLELVVGGVALLGIKSRLPTPRFHGRRRPRFIPPSMKFLKRSLFWTYVRLGADWNRNMSKYLPFRAPRTYFKRCPSFRSRSTSLYSQHQYPPPYQPRLFLRCSIPRAC